MAAYKASMDAHAALDLAISRAILEGKTGMIKLRIPLTDYAEPYEGIEFAGDAEGLAVEVEIRTGWAEPVYDVEVEEEFINESEEEDGKKTGSNQN